MASVLDIVDPDDETDILFSLNDPTGANSALYGGVSTRLVQDVSFGSPTLGNDASAAAATPRSLAFNRQARRPVSFRSIIIGSSYDNLTRALGVLGRYIADGATFRWIADGSSAAERRFIDCDPSLAPALLSGREAGLFEATQLFQTPQGVQIQLSSLPYLRGDALDPTLNKLNNATLLLDTNDDGTPNGWTITSTPTLSIVAATDSLHVVAGAATRGIFQATGAASAASGQTWTLSCEVKVASGTMALITDWRTAADATISNVSVTQTTSGWKRISITGVAPATTDHIRVRIESSGAASTFDVRNVQLEQSASASLFRVAGSQTIVVDPASTTNPPFMMPVYNPSTAPAPCVLDVAFPDASTAGVEVDYARLSNDGVMGRNRLADFLNGPFWMQAEATSNGWTATLGFEATSISDATAGDGKTSSAGSRLRITHTTNPANPALRATWTRSTLLDCLRGRFIVLARTICASTDRDDYRMQLVWGPGPTPQYTNDEVSYDTSAVTSGVTFTSYGFVNLGEIEFPEEPSVALGSITLELFTWVPSGSIRFLEVDYLLLIPATDTAAAELPDGSLQSLVGSSLTTPSKDLGAGDPTWVAGAVVGSGMRLNAVNQAAGWGDNTNGAFSGLGHHEVTFGFALTNAAMTYNVEVANLTDNTVTAGRTFTVIAALGNGTKTVSLSFDGVAAKVYQPRITITAYTGGRIDVFSMSHVIQPLLAQNQRVRSDPGSLPTRDDVEALDSSGNLIYQLSPSTTPFWLPPGLSILLVSELDAAQPGFAEQRSELARTMTVTPTVYRRDWS